jgi:hypothetical protein
MASNDTTITEKWIGTGIERSDHGLYRDLAKGTAENHETHMPVYPVSGPRFDPGFPEYEELPI